MSIFVGFWTALIFLAKVALATFGAALAAALFAVFAVVLLFSAILEATSGALEVVRVDH